MKIYGSRLPFGVPAQTFVVHASVANPMLAFVRVLEQEKFKVVSQPGDHPVRLRYSHLGKALLANEIVPTFIMGKKFRRWEYDIDVYLDAELDQHGNHAITVVSNGTPRSSNDFVFETAGQAVNGFVQAGQLLHVSEFFQGDPAAMKARGKKR